MGMSKRTAQRKMAGAAALFASASALTACASIPDQRPQWVRIFDGESLAGWTVKIAGEPAGQDKHGVISAHDGILRFDYPETERFADKYLHLFYNRELSDYRVRLEYRFTGGQAPGGPGFALLNSGIMLHAQNPLSMAVEKDFPVSVEAQMLASHPGEPQRTTGNVCTPGTNVVVNGEIGKTHCIKSSHVARGVDEWTAMEVDVRGSEAIEIYVDGQLAFSLTDPQYDPADKRFPAPNNASGLLSRGFIALQGESHSVEFRNIELLDRAPIN